MTRKEAERQTRQADTLVSLGFTRDEAESLRRISMTLQRWYERECGDGYGCIERDETTNRPMWRNANTGEAYPIPDRETGAVKRLKAIIEARNTRQADDRDGICGCGARIGHIERCERGAVSYYLQTDPRG